jgi:hypothetical protein
MDVGNGQQFPLTSRKPFIPGIGQTLRAMPITAAIIGDGDNMTASRTTIPVTSERCSPATFDGRQHFEVQTR